MKTQIIFLCVLGVIALVSCAPHGSFDNQPKITPEEIMNVESQLPCVLQQPGAVCSAIGERAKNVLPEVLQKGKCSKCTPDEDVKIQRTLLILHQEFRQYLTKLKEIYVLNVNAKYENVPSDIQKTYLPYIDCVLDRKSCNFIGDQVKKLLPDWFKNECADCDSMIKSEAKKRIPNIQKYFPEDWQLIEQKYGGKSTAKQTRPTFSAPSKSTIVIGGEKSRPKFSAPSKPTDQDNQPREKLIISGNTASPEVLFANDQSFGAKAVVCLIMKKNCDEQMKFFKSKQQNF
ncbi:hypothetical protein KQX54_021152 [Cotesia glomerata]|uniref:Uncharacterized protein n=1 Tax=Cotesia glomerata TaxID=32391 RepID=A0AAV7J8Z9_COTGL|nr:hypothetical protein KQX54_021152 [Cotesia glomerata]